MSPTSSIDFRDRLERAVSRLMGTRLNGDRARMAVPALFPSGSSAAVEIVLNGNDCFVSDMGLGQAEAEMQGASTFYDFAARKAIERFGVGYDGLSIFVVRTSLDQIETAISVVANASVNAASTAIYRALEEREKTKSEELFRKVSRAFGQSSVAREEEVIGREAAWPAHNVVTIEDRKIIFEYVTENQISIASKFMMFSDLSKSSRSYSLNSVVSNIDKLGAKGAMLADVSYVMQIAANDDDFRRRGLAA